MRRANESGPRKTKSEGISAKQLKAIWGLSHRAGFTEEELRLLVASYYGKGSLRTLTKQEAARIINDLLVKMEGGPWLMPDLSGEEGGLSEAQMAMMVGLGRRIGWDIRRLSGLAKRMYGVPSLAALDRKQASGLIEALKSIQARRAA